MIKTITASFETIDKQRYIVLRIPVDPDLNKLLKSFDLKLKTANFNLTPRELEIAEHITQRKSNKEIANHLNLSESTVKFHVSSVLRKTKSKGRWDIIARGLQGD